MPEEVGNDARLRQLLTEYFNIGELKDLCFDLSIDYEILPGDGKADKARELVAYVKRHGQRARLLAECQKLRPHVTWLEEVHTTTSNYVPNVEVQVKPQQNPEGLHDSQKPYMRNAGAAGQESLASTRALC